MNDEQLKAIRERWNKRTPGNWEWQEGLYPYRLDSLLAVDPEDHEEVEDVIYTTVAGIIIKDEDAECIANAPVDVAALLAHVDAQAERLRKLEAALREIVEFDPGEGDLMAFALMAGFARGRAHRALSDWTPFTDIVAGVDEDTAHGG